MKDPTRGRIPLLQAMHKRPAGELHAAALVSCALLAIVFAVQQVLAPGDARRNFIDMVSPVIDLLAAVAVLAAARATARRSRRQAQAWVLLSAAIFLYACGDAAWSVLEVALKEQPFPSIADAFYLAYYPVFLAGVVLLIRRAAGRSDVLRNGLDLGIMLVAAVLGFGNLLIAPILRSSGDLPWLERAILAAYPTGDLVMLGGLLLILYGEPPASAPGVQPGHVRQASVPVFLLGAGMLVMIVTDCAYSYYSLLGTYSSGGLLDLGWLASNLLLGMAGVAQWAGMQPEARPTYEPGLRFRSVLEVVKTGLPYLWLIGAFALMTAGAENALPMSFGSLALGTGAILALVLARQFVTLRENQQLNLRLRAQAASLEATNRDLNREIAERLRAQQQLAFDVLHDQMTGLANRRLFLDRLGQAIKQCRRHPDRHAAVLFMDLDQFKVVNDSLGHNCGDQLLILLGRRLVEHLRGADTVARLGGDEFAILLDGIDHEQDAYAIAEKLMKVVEQPFTIEERELHISVSTGIVMELSGYEYPEDLLRDVDLAMYQAKATGKARCVTFRPEMRDQAFSRLTLEDGLRDAVRNREFRLFYQPIKSLESSHVVAVEALLRWFHPTRGILTPADFLAVAEASDLILPIGDWVLEEACRQLKEWQTQFPQLADLAVNINLSDREFGQPRLAEKIANALRTSGLAGSSLRLEITERVLVDNYLTANDAIAALNSMGVRVEIDDFGTGYSALAYLQQFPINAIKIDKSFISDMQASRKGLGLVRAIVSMARELEMETIAEGIETGAQLEELRELSCGFGQGYLLSRPLDAATCRAFLQSAGDR